MKQMKVDMRMIQAMLVTGFSGVVFLSALHLWGKYIVSNLDRLFWMYFVIGIAGLVFTIAAPGVVVLLRRLASWRRK